MSLSLRLRDADFHGYKIHHVARWSLVARSAGRSGRPDGSKDGRPGTHLGAAVPTSSECHAERERSLARHFHPRGQRGHARQYGAARSNARSPAERRVAPRRERKPRTPERLAGERGEARAKRETGAPTSTAPHHTAQHQMRDRRRDAT